MHVSHAGFFYLTLDTQGGGGGVGWLGPTQGVPQGLVGLPLGEGGVLAIFRREAPNFFDPKTDTQKVSHLDPPSPGGWVPAGWAPPPPGLKKILLLCFGTL